MDASERAAVEAAGRAAFPAFHLRELDLVSSTQDAVRGAAVAGMPSGYCAIAAEQSAGRGRQGRVWEAPAGSALLVSLLVHLPAEVAAGASIAAGLAARAATAAAGVDARLKWPNDVVTATGKLAGILCEVEPRSSLSGIAVVAGVGINLRRTTPGIDGSTSIEEEAGTAPSPATMLASLLIELGVRLTNLTKGGIPSLRDEWMDHAHGLGQPVIAQTPKGVLRGIALGLDDGGCLLIRDGDAVHRLVAGDVHIVRG
ncbi:MAG: biotin--[acetyl-CoA-carboxylase] ligase [Candidatus Dormibacteria bacterium]